MPVGGAEDFALGVYPHLAPEVEVRFVCLRSLDVLGEEARRSGLPVDLLPVFPTKRISPLGIWRLSRWLIREGIELIHSQTYHAHIYGVLAAKLAGIPSIVHQQKTIGSLGVRKNFFLGLCFRQASAVLALSHKTSDEIRKGYNIYPDRLHVVPNAIDVEIFRPAADQVSLRTSLGLPVNVPLAGTVASLHPVKNHAAIIKALALMPSEKRPHFVFIGDGAAGRELEQMATVSGVRVSFLGRQRPVLQWLQALDFFVLASHWEGQPLALLQALACGLPVLTSRIEGNMAVLGETHPGLFDPSDFTTLASLLANACCNPQHFLAPNTVIPTCVEVAEKLKKIYTEVS